MVEFGELVTVNPGQAWSHEEHHFTPWLAEQENLDKLSEETGLPYLELVGREMREGNLRADIIARSVDDNRVVLIENQLYHADYDHLGRTLAYANAFNADIVVWVAGGFSLEPLAAYRWLNEHTKEDVDFFAVQVKVFRIGDSLMAPKFEVLERPNDWVRGTRTRLESREMTGAQKLCMDLWEFYGDRYPDDLRLRPGYNASNVYIPVGKLRTVLYVMVPPTSAVGMWVESRRRPALPESKPAIDRCNAALEKRGASWEMKVDPHDRDKWPEVADFLHENLRIFREVLELERDGKLESLDTIQPAEPQS